LGKFYSVQGKEVRVKAISVILDKAVAALQIIAGVEAVVLGGSRARGTHNADSDIDIGIYYDSGSHFDLVTLALAAGKLDDDHRENLIAGPGEWGQWVNGGGWLIIDGQHVDFILRDIARVRKSVGECQQGVVSMHYQTGHPHAYMNVMYAGELAVSRLLWDRSGEVGKLKATAEVYPLALKAAVIEFFTFEAGFSCMFAVKNAERDDLYYVTAQLVRSISALNQVLFALNKQYCLNEKKAVGMIDGFQIKPGSYKSRVDNILASAGEKPIAACDDLAQLVNEVKCLAEREKHK
jgi:predicted nucleotidyltransferase